jgi:predicted deacylase
MRTIRHPLLSSTAGTRRELESHHYGPGGPQARKVYVQAALHADEPPGMLVALKLMARLAALEQADKLSAEFVVVPVANPVGLSQWIDYVQIGRFEQNSAQNFNRHYADLTEAVAAVAVPQLVDDEVRNAAIIRAALRDAVGAVTVRTELESLRKTLLALAVDADLVIDLHCDNDAVMHLYTGTPSWPRVEPLARYLGAEASLLETDSGDSPFDEACSRTWWLLKSRFPDAAIPLGCVSATIELRGEADVDHALAEADAAALVAYFTRQGFIDEAVPHLPDLRAPATPLAGSQPIEAPHSGLVVFHVRAGQRLKKGDPVADVIDPTDGRKTTLVAGTDGVIYARQSKRFAYAGMRLAKIAGALAYRSGKLLSV